MKTSIKTTPNSPSQYCSILYDQHQQTCSYTSTMCSNHSLYWQNVLHMKFTAIIHNGMFLLGTWDLMYNYSKVGTYTCKCCISDVGRKVSPFFTPMYNTNIALINYFEKQWMRLISKEINNKLCRPCPLSGAQFTN